MSQTIAVLSQILMVNGCYLMIICPRSIRSCERRCGRWRTCTEILYTMTGNVLTPSSPGPTWPRGGSGRRGPRETMSRSRRFDGRAIGMRNAIMPTRKDEQSIAAQRIARTALGNRKAGPAMTSYVDVTHEACWVIDKCGAVWITHGGRYASVANGYKISGVPGQPWTFKVERKVKL